MNSGGLNSGGPGEGLPVFFTYLPLRTSRTLCSNHLIPAKFTMDMVEQEYHMNKDMVGLDKWGGLAAGARVSCAMRCKLRDLFRSRGADTDNPGGLGIHHMARFNAGSIGRYESSTNA